MKYILIGLFALITLNVNVNAQTPTSPLPSLSGSGGISVSDTTANRVITQTFANANYKEIYSGATLPTSATGYQVGNKYLVTIDSTTLTYQGNNIFISDKIVSATYPATKRVSGVVTIIDSLGTWVNTSINQTPYRYSPIGWKPVSEFLYASDFGVTGDSTVNSQPMLQRAIDSAIYSNKNFSIVVLPKGIVKINSTIHLGYGETFHNVSLVGQGIAFRGNSNIVNGQDAFNGTTLYANFSNAPAINIQGGRNVYVKDMTIKGVNLTVSGTNRNQTLAPTDSTIINPANFVSSYLSANADSRYAPYAGITIDAYSGNQPATSYPTVTYPTISGIGATQYNKNFSSTTTLKDLYIIGFVAAVVEQPCDADGNGDFTKLEHISIEQCKYGLSSGNTQARITSLTDCSIGFTWCGLTTGVHGRQNGRINSVERTEFGYVYKCADIRNLSINGDLNFKSCYAEAFWGLGILVGNNGSCGVSFESCTFYGGSSAFYGVRDNFVNTYGLLTTSFNNCQFGGNANYIFNNQGTAKINLNNCAFLTNITAGSNYNDSTELYFRRAARGVIITNPRFFSVTNCTVFEQNSTYGEENNLYIGTKTTVTDNYTATNNRICAWDTRADLSYYNTRDAGQYIISNQANRFPLVNAPMNNYQRRFAMQNIYGIGGFPFSKGDLIMQGDVSGLSNLIFAVDSARNDSIILRLENNYYFNGSGNFVKYITQPQAPNSYPSGNLYYFSSKMFVSPESILGDFTNGSKVVQNILTSNGGAYSNTNLEKRTPLYTGHNRVYGWAAQSNFIDSISTVATDKIYIAQPATRTGRFPIGNSFSQSIETYTNSQYNGTTPITVQGLTVNQLQAGASTDLVVTSASGVLRTQTAAQIIANGITKTSVTSTFTVPASGEYLIPFTLTGTTNTSIVAASYIATDVTGCSFGIPYLAGDGTGTVKVTNRTASAVTFTSLKVNFAVVSY